MFRQSRPPDPDQDLVTRAQQGDTRAFDALILKYDDKLCGLVYNMTSHKEGTHDLLQDIFACGLSVAQKVQGQLRFLYLYLSDIYQPFAQFPEE
jgi:RNA polymerase sigma-70 factor (ECF subfamily)